MLSNLRIRSLRKKSTSLKAVKRWREESVNEGCASSEVLETIRLPLIESRDLMTVVMNHGLVTESPSWEAIHIRECRPWDKKK